MSGIKNAAEISKTLQARRENTLQAPIPQKCRTLMYVPTNRQRCARSELARITCCDKLNFSADMHMLYAVIPYGKYTVRVNAMANHKGKAHVMVIDPKLGSFYHSTQHVPKLLLRPGSAGGQAGAAAALTRTGGCTHWGHLLLQGTSGCNPKGEWSKGIHRV